MAKIVNVVASCSNTGKTVLIEGLIKEVQEEIPLEELIKQVEDFDFIIIEGYKKSKYRKLEVYRQGISKKIITPKEKLIGVASDVILSLEGVRVVNLNNYEEITNLVIEN